MAGTRRTEYAPDASSHEPLLTRAGLTAIAGAVLSLATSFGLDLTQAQQASLTTLLVVGAPMVAAFWARRKTWSGATVVDLLTRPPERR